MPVIHPQYKVNGGRFDNDSPILDVSFHSLHPRREFVAALQITSFILWRPLGLWSFNSAMTTSKPSDRIR
jgi:hypothetical protein